MAGGIRGITVEIGGDTTKLGKALADVNKKTSDLQKELRGVNSLLKMDPGNVELLAQKQDILSDAIGETKKKLDTLKKAQSQVQKQFENGDIGASEYRDFQREIIATEKKLDGLEKELNNVNDENKKVEKSTDKASDSIDDLADSASKADGKVGNFAKSLGGVLGKGLAGVTAMATGVVAGFVALGESSQEYTEDMGKLETAFTTSGHSAETAKKAYEGMVGILGETDQSVEAVNHLAKLTKNEEELAKWTDIATGVYATFGDSLPIEGLTEAANETAKVGQVTGPLADALNWAGISEDEFNEKLAECNSEQERATLITETLTEQYQEASDKYKEVNGDLIEARKAQDALNNSVAELGQVAVPITTVVKQALAGFLSSLLPGVQQVGQGLSGLLNGVEGSGEQLKSGMLSIVNSLTTTITNALPTILTTGTAIITALIEGILSALPTVSTTIVQFLPQITNSLLGLLPLLVTTLSNIITSLLTSLGTLLPEIVNQIILIVPQIIDALVASIPQLIQGAIQFLMAIVEAIPTIIQNLMTAIPQIIQSLVDGLIIGIPLLIQGAIQLFNAIVRAIPQILPPILEALPQIIDTLVEGLLIGLPMLLEGAIQLLMAIIDALPVFLPILITALPQITQTITFALLSHLPELIQCAVQLFMALVQAIPQICVALVQALPQIITTVISSLIEPLKNLFPGVYDGIVHVFQNIGTWFGNVFSGAWDAIKVVWELVAPYFQQVWNTISQIFSVVKTFFGGMFESAWTAIKVVWDAVTGYFKQIWETIKGIFSVVKNVLTGNWQDAWNGIKGIVSGWISYFSGVWSGIKGVFSSVKTWFSNTFKSAWTAIKNVFSGWGTFFSGLWNKIKNTFSTLGTSISNAIGGSIKSGINSVITLIENTVNSAIDLINGAIDLINNAPGVTIGHVGRLSLPRLAKGGVVYGPTIAQIGEDGAEAVIPLEKNTRWMDKLAEVVAKKVKNNKLSVNVKADLNKLTDVGGQVMESLSEGILNTKDEVINAIDYLITDSRTEVQKINDEANKIQLDSERKYAEESARIESEKQNNKTEAQKTADQQYLDGLKATAEQERKIYDATLKDIENYKQQAITNIKNTVNATYEDIENLKGLMSSLEDRLNNFGSLYGEQTALIFNGEELKKTGLSNLSYQVDQLKEYESLLLQVKDRGIPDEFFDQLRGMSVEEGIEYSRLLVDASDEVFNDYIKNWELKRDTAREISKMLYQDEVSELTEAVTTGFDDLQNNFYGIGEESAGQFGDGFLAELNGVLTTVKNSISTSLKGLLPSVNKNVQVSVSNTNIPQMALGGIATRSTIVEVGEDGKEAILPLEKNTGWINELSRRLNGPRDLSSNSDGTLLNKLDQIYDRLSHLQIVLDSDVLVGETIDKIDQALGDKQLLSERGI